MNRRSKRRTGAAVLPLALLGAGVLLSASACDTNKLLEVKDPAVATPESLSDPSALPTLYYGAIGDFQLGYDGSGGSEGYTLVSAVMADELSDADTYPTRIATDGRRQQPVQMGNTSDAAFSNLQRARHSAELAAAAIAENSEEGASDPRIATLKALEGFTYVALGEGFCGYIPFSEEVGNEGVPLTQAQVFDSAVVRFDAALAVDPNFDLAKIGKGRALLDNGDFAGAAAAVAGVPTDFVWEVQHSANSSRQNNPIYSIAGSNGRYTVGDNEGVNGLPYRSALDPRVIWKDKGAVGFDNSTPMYLDLRANTYDMPTAMATGVEARLIEAEAALHNGDATTWLNTLNDLRADVGSLMAGMVPGYADLLAENADIPATLDTLADPNSDVARQDLMFRERAFWLFITGHRLGDMRRLVRQYGRAQNTVFATGAYYKGDDYGNDVAFPIPFNERQNTNYHPEQCSVTTA